MTEDPFDTARRSIAAAQRRFEAQADRARRQIEQAHARLFAAQARFQRRAEAAGRRIAELGAAPPQAPPRRPGSERGGTPDDPQPAPVRPPAPSPLSGGAAASLDR